jgi:putative acetyltransferase
MACPDPRQPVIRLEQPADRSVALEVERLAFQNGRSGAPADDIVEIVERIRDEDGSFAFVALEGERIVAHVQFSRGWIGDTPVITLGPVAVMPDRQRLGIGSSVIRAGLAEAARRGEVAAIVLGSPRFYERFGFAAGFRRGISNPASGVTAEGFEIREEHFMVVDLVSGDDVPLSGDVRWHAAFD